MTSDVPISNDLPPAFRQAMRQLAASVALITTFHDGQRHGMAATAVTSVTADPPTLLVCVNRNASLHEPLMASTRFAVNLLGVNHEPLVSLFSGKLAGESRFEHGAWSASQDGVPMLGDALAVLVCDVTQSVQCGSHTVVFGAVREIDLPGVAHPLIYHDGKFLPVPEAAPSA